jgi:hypothetical protein
MQTSLTWADAILTFVIGVIGSLCAAYLFVRGPSYIDWVANLYAETSRRRALRRTERLTKRLVLISELEADNERYVGFMLELALRVLVGFFFATLSFVAITSILTGERVLRIIDPTHSSSLSAPRQTILLVMVTMGTGFVFYATSAGARIRSYSDLKRLRKVTDEQIASLRTRWPSLQSPTA